MSSSTSSMPHLPSASTQSERLSSSLSEPTLDTITVTRDAAPFLNRPEYGEDAVYHGPARDEINVFWHLGSGLIVSPNVTHLPRIVPELQGPTDFRGSAAPKVLPDGLIYLAFRPRFIQNTGDLFGRLNLNRAGLSDLITPAPGAHFALSPEVSDRWCRLEEALIHIGTTLIAAIPSLPSIDYPKFPWQYGYRDVHRNRQAALHCAGRARDAFADLTALVSFAISLHMKPFTGLTEAFRLIQAHKFYGLRPESAWLDLLAISHVCKFEPNFRIGAFINPYISRWTRYIGNFANAEVPIWVYWGHHYYDVPPVDLAATKFLPNEDEINYARAREAVTSTLTMPNVRRYTYAPAVARVHPPAGVSNNTQSLATTRTAPFPTASHINDDYHMGEREPASPQWQMSNSPVRDSPLSPSPRPETPPLLDIEDDAARKAKALAALQEHFRRLEDVRESRIAKETPLEKQRREAWEKHANTTRMYTKSSAVYEWRERPDGTYERVKLASSELDTWQNYTRNQRRYVGHANLWELCPQLPEFSVEFPRETEPYSDDDDTDDELPVFHPPSVPPPRAPPDNQLFKKDIRQLTQAHTLNAGPVDIASTVPEVETFDFADFVAERFGFDIFSPTGWTTNFVPSDKANGATFEQAMAALSSINAPPGPAVKDAVMTLVKTLSDASRTFEHLFASFDHTRDRALSLESATLQIHFVLDDVSTKYIIAPKGYIDRVPWGILLADASTVLLIFRHSLTTTSAIVRMLVKLGVPFHTVVAADANFVKPRTEPVRGLGIRPSGYKPSCDDYSEYLRRRKDLLTGPKGRAALMYGGVVARIARDVLEHHDTVLDGPSSDAVTVARHRHLNLYDDALTENDANIICGVYFVDAESGPTPSKQVAATENFPDGTKSHMSFFPKDTTWKSSGAYLRLQWSEMAEVWYQQRKARIERDFELVSASKWRTILRKSNTLLKAVEHGTEHYQAGYLEDYHRQTRFVAERR